MPAGRPVAARETGPTCGRLSFAAFFVSLVVKNHFEGRAIFGFLLLRLKNTAIWPIC